MGRVLKKIQLLSAACYASYGTNYRNSQKTSRKWRRHGWEEWGAGRGQWNERGDERGQGEGSGMSAGEGEPGYALYMGSPGNPGK